MESANDAQQEVRYAGFWVRVAAYLIDGFVVSALTFALAIPYSLFAGSSSVGNETDITTSESVLVLLDYLLAYVILFGVPWLYNALMESCKIQATLGKLALGLIVSDTKGGRLSFARATGRYFAHLFSIIPFGIGYLFVAFTKQKRALHDFIAGTVVVKRDETKS